MVDLTDVIVVLWIVSGLLAWGICMEKTKDLQHSLHGIMDSSLGFVLLFLFSAGGLLSLWLAILRQMPKYRLSTTDGSLKLHRLGRANHRNKVLKKAVALSPSYGHHCTLQIRHWGRWQIEVGPDWFDWKARYDALEAAIDLASIEV